MGKYYAILGLAIVAEVIATTALSRSAGFSKIVPTAIAVIGYLVAFYCLSITMKVMATGVIYAIWSGLGVVLIAAVGWVFYKQVLDAPAMIGLTLILAGVLVINLFSKTVSH